MNGHAGVTIRAKREDREVVDQSSEDACRVGPLASALTPCGNPGLEEQRQRRLRSNCSVYGEYHG